MITPVTAQSYADSSFQVNRSGLSIVENGTDRLNNRLFTIQADRVDVADILRTFFKRAGVEAAIDQDVTGLVNLSIKNVVFRDALQWIVQVSRPQIKISKGKNDNIYHVTRDFDAQRTADAIASRIESSGGLAGRNIPGVSPGVVPPNMPRVVMPNMMQNGVPADRLITLDVPDDHPIPLTEALNRISALARFPIFVDRRIPRELSFAGTITEAPLPLVLQTIASTSGLKLLASGTQATFVPTDQFSLRVSDMLLGQYPNMQCSKCSRQISSLWSYCPHCGQLTPRGAQLLNQKNLINKQNPTVQPLRNGEAPNRKP